MADLSEVWLGVSLLVGLAVYGFVRARIGFLTKTLLQQFSAEQARLEQAVQSAQAQCREQHLAATIADDFAECIQQNVLTPVLVADGKGLLVSANPAARSLLGVDAVQAGESITAWAVRHNLQYLSGQPVPPGAVPLTRAIQEKQRIECAEFLLLTGQAQRIIELTAVPLQSAEEDRCVGAMVFLNDVTALRHSLNQEIVSVARIAALTRLSQYLAVASSSEQVNRAVTEGVLTLLPPDTVNVRASLYGMEADAKRLVLLSETPDRRPRRPRTRPQALMPSWPFNAQSPLLWQLYVSRQPVVSADIPKDEQFDDESSRSLLSISDGVPAISLLAVPLVVGKQVTGHLMLTSSQKGAFDVETLQETLTGVAALAAIAQAKVLLDEQTHRQAAELKAIWTVSQAVTSHNDLQGFADMLTDKVRRVFEAELCLLSLWDATSDGERHLHCLGNGHKDALLPGQATNQSPVGCAECDHISEEAALYDYVVMRTGINNPPFGDCRWRAFAGQSGVHSVLASPLRQGGEALGVLTLYRSTDAPFTPPQVELLEMFASLFVTAVQSTKEKSSH